MLTPVILQDYRFVQTAMSNFLVVGVHFFLADVGSSKIKPLKLFDGAAGCGRLRDIVLSKGLVQVFIVVLSSRLDPRSEFIY